MSPTPSRQSEASSYARKPSTFLRRTSPRYPTYAHIHTHAHAQYLFTYTRMGYLAHMQHMMSSASMPRCRTSLRYTTTRVLHALLHIITPHTHICTSGIHTYMYMITYQNNQSFGPSDMVLPPQRLHTLPYTSTQQTHAHLSNTRVHEYVCHVQKLSRLARWKWCCRLDIALVPCYQARGQQRIGEMRIVKLLSPISTSRYKVWTNSAFKQCRCLRVFVREKESLHMCALCLILH